MKCVHRAVAAGWMLPASGSGIVAPRSLTVVATQHHDDPSKANTKLQTASFIHHQSIQSSHCFGLRY